MQDEVLEAWLCLHEAVGPVVVEAVHHPAMMLSPLLFLPHGRDGGKHGAE